MVVLLLDDNLPSQQNLMGFYCTPEHTTPPLSLLRVQKEAHAGDEV